MNFRVKFMLGAASAALLVPTACFAQDAAAQQTTETDLNDIIVTANKREENLNKVGSTITAVVAEDLVNPRVASLEDVASVAPGLVYTPSTNSTPIFTLRGIGFNESSLGVYPAVSVYVDQVPLPFPILAAHSAYDLERIEVLKGPQGTLFGQNSTGGAINYIAARPTDHLEAGGDISYGRFNSIEGNAYISGPLSNTARARLAINGKNSDGWQKSYTRRDSNGAESYIAGRFALDWEPSETISLSFTANGWKDKSEPQAQQLIAVHEQIGTGGTKVLSATPVVDPLRNSYSPPPPGCPSAQFCYPFPARYNARVADWSVLERDPNTSPSGPSGVSDPALASDTSFEPRGDRDFWQAALRADIEFGSITLTSLTSYGEFNQDITVDGDGMRVVSYDIQRGLGSIETFNQELRLANDPVSRFRWVVGANYEKSNTRENQSLRYWANSNFFVNNVYINQAGIDLSQDIKNYAFFGNVEFDISDRLKFKASGRYTNSKNQVLNRGYGTQYSNLEKLWNILGGLSGLPFTPIGPGDSFTLNSIGVPIPKDVTVLSKVQSGVLGLGIPGIPLEAILEQDNVSWRVGFDFKATDDVLLYANASRGYKAGSFPVLAAAQYTSALPVTQEKVTAYEAGVKAGFADGAIQLNAAGFYMDYRDKQIRGKLFDFVFGTLDTLVNIPKSRIYGFEADVTVRPTAGLTMTGAVTYLNSKVQRFVGYDIFGGVDNDIDSRAGNFDPSGLTPNTEDFAGVKLPYTPKWSGSVNVDYRHKLPSGGEPFVGVTVSARSSQDAAIGGGDTTLPVSGTNRYRIAPGVGPYPYQIDGYATVDARIGYEAPDGQWRAMLWGKNIFDKYYWTAVVPSSDSTGRLAGRPATYGITLGFKFR